MNNNSVQINRYLQNEMSAEERTAFEGMLAIDESLRYELQAQRQVIRAVENAGLKHEFAKAINHRVVVRRMITWSAVAAVLIGIILVFNFRENISPDKLFNPGNISGQQIADIVRPFVNPPLTGINVPLAEYSLDAEKGGTLYYKSGSIIHFPPSSLIDASGNPVKGIVKITYREFADPLDFFVSGIPMNYDSAGTKYNFESSGMCEINAFKDNKAIFVNENAKPEINLSVTNKSSLHNLYFLDTANRKWEYQGKDIITEVKTLSNNKPAVKPVSFLEKGNLPSKPVMPKKASGDLPKFRVEINPVAFEELHAYDGLQFEVVDERNYHASDANEQWATMQLERTAVEGIYNIVFINSTRKVTYKVRPVLEGSDYDAALKLFNEKKLAYERALKMRISMEQVVADSIRIQNQKVTAKMNADKEWNDKMNAMIVARNKEMKALQQKAIIEQKKMMQEQEQKTLEEQQKILEEMQRLSQQQAVPATIDPASQATSKEVFRTFTILRFGTWNCDQPMPPAIFSNEMLNKEMRIAATYIDSLNNKLNLTNVSVVYRRFNGLTRCGTKEPISVMLGEENMLWGNMGAFFYYFSYKDFKEAGIDRKSNEFIFRMRMSPKPIKSYEDIRRFVEKI